MACCWQGLPSRRRLLCEKLAEQTGCASPSEGDSVAPAEPQRAAGSACGATCPGPAPYDRGHSRGQLVPSPGDDRWMDDSITYSGRSGPPCDERMAQPTDGTPSQQDI